MDSKIPGLVRKSLKSGQTLFYWQVTKQAREMGFKPQTIRLHSDDPIELEELCRLYNAEMREWMDIQRGTYRIDKDATIANLFREYRLRPESPFNCRIKENTKRTYSQSLDWIEARIGGTPIATIKLATLRRWYDEARYPDGPDGDEHIHTAYRIIEMLRRVFSFGVAAEIEGCDRVHAILSNSQFERPRPRDSAITREQVETFVAKAVEMGRRSLALATAIQFECAFRQKDVIGEWLKDPPKWTTSEIFLNRKTWANGLTWADIRNDWCLDKRTTKTGQVVSHDLKLTVMAIRLLSETPTTSRMGPLIVDERTGRPYADRCFGPEWRKVADAAGLPRDVWSMDCRAGAATEASEAGATIDDLRETMGHSDAKTTQRYMRGKKLAQSQRIASLRLAGLN